MSNKQGIHTLQYAQYYDLIYSQDKNYEKECEFVEHAYRAYSSDALCSLLDVACGTGRHAIELAKRGYQVDAFDISPNMLSVARKNAAVAQLKISFSQGSMQSYQCNKTYDVVMCMYASIAYLHTKRDITRTLNMFSSALKPGGMLIVDFWNRDLFETQYERLRVKDFTSGGYRILRYSVSKLNKKAHCLDIEINALVVKGKRVVLDMCEHHRMRYYAVDEIKRLLSQHGFIVRTVAPLLQLKGTCADSWILNVVATKK